MSEPQYLKKTTVTDYDDVDDILKSLKKKGRSKKRVSGEDISKITNKKMNKEIEKKEKRTTVKSEIKELNLKIDKLTNIVIKLSKRLEEVYQFVDE
tara:strand:- start:77 stop:364 length:288 start_codon:yes stop_codon:yes gene_type:complete